MKFFVPGRLKNLLNVREHWSGHAEYKRRWRAAVQAMALANNWRANGTAAVPKDVTLTAYTWNVLDSHDGLRAALKPVVDGLIDAGFIHSDAAHAGHRFLYAQEVRREQRGVLIQIEPLVPGARPTEGA